MLKETEETRLFVTLFFIDGISIGWARIPGYAYDCNFNAICDIKVLRAFLIVCPCVHDKETLMVLFCMIMSNM